jgi:hypothetical protein
MDIQALQLEIENKKRDRHRATHELVNQAENRVRQIKLKISICSDQLRKNKLMSEKSMHEKNLDIIYKIAARNFREYDFEIEILKDRIKMALSDDPAAIQADILHKTACFKITGQHDALLHDISKSVNGHIDIIINGEYCHVEFIYKKMVYLHDLRKDDPEIMQFIFVMYKFALSSEKTEYVVKYIDLCKVLYMIPYRISKMTRLSNILKEATPICQDNICDILSYLNDGVVDKKTIDTMVYEY